MYSAPSRRKSRTSIKKPNLSPILDAVFIFIFFLIMSANFIKVFEISSDIPLISESPPPKNQKKPLALTLKITQKGLGIFSGIPSKHMRTFPPNQDGSYKFVALKEFLIDIRKRYPEENSIIFEPQVNINYLKLIEVMDAVKILTDTDESFYAKDNDGIDVKKKYLFDNIVFGNIQS